MFLGVIATVRHRQQAAQHTHWKVRFIRLAHGVLHLGGFAKYAAAFFRKAAVSSRWAFLRLSLVISAYWSFCSAKGCPVCRRFACQAYNVSSVSPRSCATLGMSSLSARSNACSLNDAVYVLWTVHVVTCSFLLFMTDLGFRDCSLG